MAGFSDANPTPFSTQHMGFDDTSDAATSRFYQMVPIGGARRVTVEHDRDSVLLIGPGGFATVRNTRTGAGIADRLALRGAGQIEIELSGQSDGRMFISIEDGVRTLSHLIVSVKTARQVTYKHWAYTDATVHKPNNIDNIISRTENNIKILFLNQSNIVMSKSTNTEDLNIQFSLQEQSPIDKSNKIIFLDHKAHGCKFAADNETGLSDAINTSGGKGVTVNFLWTPDWAATSRLSRSRAATIPIS